MLYIELGDLFPPQHQQQQQQRTTTTTTTIISGTFVCRNRTWGRTGGRAGACAHGLAHARASLKKQSANNQRTNNKQQTANNKRTKNKVSGRFRDGFGTVSGRFRDGFGTVSKSGSIGTVLGTLLVPKAEFSPEENQRSERYLREHLGIRSPALLAYPRGALPPCPRTLEYLCRSKPPHGSANFGGSPRTKGTREMADLGDTETWRNRA